MTWTGSGSPLRPGPRSPSRASRAGSTRRPGSPRRKKGLEAYLTPNRARPSTAITPVNEVDERNRDQRAGRDPKARLTGVHTASSRLSQPTFSSFQKKKGADKAERPSTLKNGGSNLLHAQAFGTIPEVDGGQSQRPMLSKYLKSVNKWAGGCGGDQQPASAEMSATQSFNTPRAGTGYINLFHDSKTGAPPY